jgi:hypothetical protein
MNERNDRFGIVIVNNFLKSFGIGKEGLDEAVFGGGCGCHGNEFPKKEGGLNLFQQVEDLGVQSGANACGDFVTNACHGQKCCLGD